jgi:peroxiredoxin
MGRMRNLIPFALAALSVIPAAAQTPRPAGEFVITMTDGSQKLLSSYKGKTVCLAFFFTTCPHCQDMAKVLSQVQPEYTAKGVQILAAAFDDSAKEGTPAFVAQFVRGGFPMGYSDRGSVLEFLQKSIMTQLFVPIMVFIDRKGMIQDTYIGDETFLRDPPHNVRAELDKILAKTPPAKTPPKTLTHISKK